VTLADIEALVPRLRALGVETFESDGVKLTLGPLPVEAPALVEQGPPKSVRERLRDALIPPTQEG
jgi:hypothetical protein